MMLYAFAFCRFLKKDVPTRGCLGYLCCCCFRAPQATITVHLDSAQDLAKQDIVGTGENIDVTLGQYKHQKALYTHIAIDSIIVFMNGDECLKDMVLVMHCYIIHFCLLDHIMIC